MVIGIYCRVSTEEQAEKGISLLNQEKKGIEYSLKMGYNYKVYKDVGISGAKSIDERKGLSDLIDALYQDEIDGIYCIDIDRLGRKYEIHQIIKSILLENSKILVINDEQIDLEDENQELLSGMKSLLSEFEIKKLSSRIKKALKRSVMEGRVGGGNLITYGYKKGADKKMVIDEYEAEVVRYIYKLSLLGKGTKKIANILNEEKILTKRDIVANRNNDDIVINYKWRDAVVYRILTNKTYIGKRRFKGEYYDCPKIISYDLFYNVQKILKTNNNFKDTTNKYFYLLKGLITCGYCEKSMYGHKGGKHNVYKCITSRYGESCKNRAINIDKIEKYVLEFIKKLPKILDKYTLQVSQDKEFKKLSKRIKKNRDELKVLYNKRERIIDLYEEGVIEKDILNNRIRVLNSEINEIENHLKTNTLSADFVDKRDVYIKKVKEIIDILNFEDITNDKKRQVLRSIINAISVKYNKIRKVHYIYIETNISNFTPIKLNTLLTSQYDDRGWTIDKNGPITNIEIVTLSPSPYKEQVNSYLIDINLKNDIRLESYHGEKFIDLMAGH